MSAQQSALCCCRLGDRRIEGLGPTGSSGVRTPPPPQGNVSILTSIAQSNGKTAEQQSPLAVPGPKLAVLELAEVCQTGLQPLRRIYHRSCLASSKLAVKSTKRYGWRGGTAALAARFSASNTTNKSMVRSKRVADSRQARFRQQLCWFYSCGEIPCHDRLGRDLVARNGKGAVPFPGPLASSGNHSGQSPGGMEGLCALTADAYAAI